MEFTCKVVRGFGTIAPCLEHVRAGGGGGGSVVIVPFLYIYHCVPMGVHLYHFVLVGLRKVTRVTLPW